MEWRGDNRGQSVQVGAILLFATLIIALSMYQVTVVPEENSRIEFDAYQEASADIVELRNSVLSTAAGDGVRGVTVKTGAQYPPRIFLVNSLQPRGSVETTNPGTITLRNVNGSVSEYQGVGEYTQEEDSVLNYSTKLLRFEPDYNYQSIPDIYVTSGFVYRDYDRPIPRASQTLIQGNTITITTIAGNLDESGYRTALTTVPVSAHVNTVTVTSNSSGPVKLTVPTRLNAADWNNTVLEGSKTYVEDVVPGPRPDTVTVELNASQNYELKVAQVEAKGANDDDEVDDSKGRYLVQQTAEYATLNVDNRVKLVTESRDIFNNPRSNSPVTFDTDAANLTLESTSGSLSGTELTVRSNEEGRAAVWAEATGKVSNATVIATLGTDTGGTPAERVTFTVSEPQAGGGGGTGGGGGGNGGGQTFITYVSAFNDGDGNTEANEDSSIPTQQGPFGNINNFDKMTAEDGTTARIETTYVNPGLEQTIDTGTRVATIDTGSTYALEFAYFFENGNAGQVNVAILDDSGTVLQSASLDQSQTRSSTNGSPPGTAIQLNTQASNYIDNNGEIYVEFRTPGSEKDYTQFLVDYLRIQTN
ncbi:hypothetical protein LPA44_17075 [Halobacterium sp. KA-4]|uniref:hypothetical protein n=1 Tax=Halobacterium sp. KA-4 TaxID=2896367 RepID=UPI001E2E4858|nr:hypothetical protein [Halobacterium sp. KA-4]MCD2201577.1 hypothetical protein [Halobacterium sp. KA-4]